MTTLTQRQQEILSNFARSKNVAIPYMKCDPNDPEIKALAEAGYVKIGQCETPEGKPYWEFCPNFDSPVFSCGIGAPQTGQVGKTMP
ncbi:MAG: hypothetical protein LBI05_10950 [Planctomycetaceae bacterium]|nr:hypothetical protein [Planctomycetaceae bacterium]